MTSCLLLSTYLAACGGALQSMASSALPAARATMVADDTDTRPPVEVAVAAFATLNGSGFAPPVTTIGTGSCALSVSLARDAIVRVATTLSAPVEVHLHVAGSARQVELSPQLDAAGAPRRGASWSSTFPIDDAMLAALLRGDLYCDVHTAAYPEGEVRGTLSARP